MREAATSDRKRAYLKVAVRRLYDAQKLRIQSDLRIQALVRDGVIPKETAETDFLLALEHEEAAEHEYERIVWREIKDLPIVRDWMIKVRGVGRRMAGLFVGLIGDPGRFETVSKLWAYSGLHVVGGSAARREKGVKANWSQELKTTAWKLATSFVRAGEGPYRDRYLAYKNRIIRRELANDNIIWKTSDSGRKEVAYLPPRTEFRRTVATPVQPDGAGVARGESASIEAPTPPEKPEWTLGRIERMAYRYVAKLFLSHLWEVWRENEGHPVRVPYILDGHPPHSHYSDPWSMIDDDKPANWAPVDRLAEEREPVNV